MRGVATAPLCLYPRDRTMHALNTRPGLLVLLSTALLFSATPNRTLGEWHRASNDPVISPQGDGWESAGTFNPAVVPHQGKIVMLYRTQGRNGTSSLGY